jgi:hypothetical protein
LAIVTSKGLLPPAADAPVPKAMLEAVTIPKMAHRRAKRT